MKTVHKGGALAIQMFMYSSQTNITTGEPNLQIYKIELENTNIAFSKKKMLFNFFLSFWAS